MRAPEWFSRATTRMLPPWERPPLKMLLAFLVALGLVLLRLFDGIVTRILGLN